ncbi:MAG: hypothetical protein KDJ15_04650 [Alphaproteobacteria bacterium]|nr:hypothetical protein [Alphaproteobacteria bacterium]
MINLIGIRRLILIGVLVAVNVCLALAVFWYLVPDNERLDRQVRSVKGQVSGKRVEVDQMRIEFDQIQDKRAYFNALKEAGLLDPQDLYSRIWMERRIGEMQEIARLRSAEVQISAPEILDNPFTRESNYGLVDTRVTVKVDAVKDTEIYNFLYWMENGFPGHASIVEMALDRKNDISDVTLRQIGTGTPVTMMTGQVVFSWKTLAPQEKEDNDGMGGGY